jgi:hypothetical protein
LLVAVPATAYAPNTPLQPAGAAVTGMFCDPTQPLQLPNVKLAAQLLFSPNFPLFLMPFSL